MQEKVTVINYTCDCCKRYLSKDGKPIGKKKHLHIKADRLEISISEFQDDIITNGKWIEHKKNIQEKELQFCDFECMMAYFKSFFPKGC